MKIDDFSIHSMKRNSDLKILFNMIISKIYLKLIANNLIIYKFRETMKLYIELLYLTYSN